jgi:hypothetical protein
MDHSTFLDSAVGIRHRKHGFDMQYARQMLLSRNIRNIRTQRANWRQAESALESSGPVARVPATKCGMVLESGMREPGTAMIQRWHRILNDPNFWNRKLRIAILTFATFAALC